MRSLLPALRTRREAPFTIPQLEVLFRETDRIGTIQTVYFEGGEAFLHYAALVEGVRLARAAGLEAGIVTNAYWATSLEDAVSRLCGNEHRSPESVA